MNVFIADDEIAVLNGLKCIIDWNALGFSVCGEATNGEDALQKILSLRPDLVLMDIRMPRLTGMDVIKQARENDFEGKFIIISGYSDFTYAQTAIRYNVEYYLTKPIDEDELEKCVITIRDAYLSQRKQQNRMHHYKEKAKLSIIKDILQNQTDCMMLDLNDLSLTASSYQVIFYENYNQSDFHNTWNFADLFHITNQEHNAFDRLTLNDHEVVLLKGIQSVEKFKRLLSHYELRPQKGSPLDSLFLTYGRIVYHPEDIHLSFEDANTLLHRRFFCEPNQHILGPQNLPDEKELLKSHVQKNADYYSQSFVDFIQAHQKPKITRTLQKLKNQLYYSNDEIVTMKHFLADIYIQIKAVLSYTYTSAEIPFPSNSSIIELIENKYYLYEILQFFVEHFEMCMNAVGCLSSETILDDIIYYIHHNFKESLKLETIASLFGYNSSYLGKIFHKKTGESFNSFIDRIRINESQKLLLEQNLKVYEIAEQVGYKNVDYFHKKFRKYVDMSPAEYRRAIIKS